MSFLLSAKMSLKSTVNITTCCAVCAAGEMEPAAAAAVAVGSTQQVALLRTMMEFSVTYRM